MSVKYYDTHVLKPKGVFWAHNEERDTLCPACNLVFIRPAEIVNISALALHTLVHESHMTKVTVTQENLWFIIPRMDNYQCTMLEARSLWLFRFLWIESYWLIKANSLHVQKHTASAPATLCWLVDGLLAMPEAGWQQNDVTPLDVYTVQPTAAISQDLSQNPCFSRKLRFCWKLTGQMVCVNGGKDDKNKVSWCVNQGF